MNYLERRLSQLETSQAEREAEEVAVRLGCPVKEVLAELEQIRAGRARFRRAHGRDLTRAEQVAALAAEHGISEAEVRAELAAIEASS